MLTRTAPSRTRRGGDRTRWAAAVERRRTASRVAVVRLARRHAEARLRPTRRRIVRARIASIVPCKVAALGGRHKGGCGRLRGRHRHVEPAGDVVCARPGRAHAPWHRGRPERPAPGQARGGRLQKLAGPPKETSPEKEIWTICMQMSNLVGETDCPLRCPPTGAAPHAPTLRLCERTLTGDPALIHPRTP